MGANDELLRAEYEFSHAAQHVFGMDMSEHKLKEPIKDFDLFNRYAVVHDSFVQKAMQLADDAAAVLGKRHWVWQLGASFSIDLFLSLAEQRPEVVGTDTDGLIMIEVVTDLVDMWDWLASVGLSEEPGCWLYTRAVRL